MPVPRIYFFSYSIMDFTYSPDYIPAFLYRNRFLYCMDSILLSFAFRVFCKYFFPLDREDLLNLMDLAKDSPDAKQELLERLLSGKRMTGRDEMDIKRILKTKEALDNIRNFIDKQQLTNSDTPKKSTVPNEDKKGIR